MMESWLALSAFFCLISSCCCAVLPGTTDRYIDPLHESVLEDGNEYNASDNDVENYFTNEWRSRYSENSLAQQPKWRLAEKQTGKKLYEIREYLKAQWADTTTCVNERNADEFRRRVYKRLTAVAESDVEIPLLFPLIIRVEKNGPDIPSYGPKKQDFTDCRYSFQFYFPLLGARGDLDLHVEYRPISTFYVLPYDGNCTVSRCNEKANQLRHLLEQQKADFNSLVWFCAQNGPELGKREPSYEVWYEKALNK